MGVRREIKKETNQGTMVREDKVSRACLSSTIFILWKKKRGKALTGN